MTGGAWASSNTAIGTIGSSGIVMGVSAGSITISYTFTNGCGTAVSTQVVIVNPLPNAGTISGSSIVCVSASTTLTDGVTGGVWTATNSNAFISSIGSVYGMSIGTDTIIYTYTNSCGTATTNKTVTVNPLPNAGTITGSSNVCVSSTINLSNASPGGVWSSSNTGVASIGSTGIVTGSSVGTTTISYTVTNSCGTAVATEIITVNPLPNAGTISGPSSVCVVSAITLSNTVTGGTWNSSNTAIATIGSSGIATGVSSGATTISYSYANSCGTATATKTVTVNPLPNAGSITGLSTVCVSSTITLTNTVTGGSWSSSNTLTAAIGSTGIVTGVAAGTTTISYTFTNGCGTAYATQSILVNPLPTAGAISGTSTVCISSSTILTDGVTGGVWTTTNGNAIISSTGSVLGMIVGIDTAIYTYINSCGTATTEKIVTINPLPNAGTISGTSTVCVSSAITLSNTVSGGTWSSSNTAIGTIGSTGIVTGVTAGTATISYLFTNSCGTATTIRVITVNPLPNAGAISGASSLCVSSSTTLTDGVTGGTWAATNGDAIISSGGNVYGMASGVDTIIYTYNNSCGTATATKIVSINPLPNAGTITGASAVCVSSTITLTNIVTGGTWSSSNILAATIGSTGIVTGVAAGTTTISYVYTNSCGTAISTKTVTVNPLPNAGTITGASNVCAGSTITLSNTVTGGTWSSSNTAIGTIGSSGMFIAIINGVDTVKYINTNGCGAATAIKIVTINPLPIAGTISGSSTVCAGSTIPLSNTTTGGTWSSSNTAIATIGSSGIVTAILSGLDTIKYTKANSCGFVTAIHLVTINPLPNAGAIFGLDTVCLGNTISLSDTVADGSWTSTNGNSFVSTGGAIYGITAGIDTIKYAITNGCGTATTQKVIHIINCSTEVNNINEPSDIINLYPNPTQNYITISSTGKITNVLISNLLGQNVFSGVYDTKEAVISLNQLASGVYVVKINDYKVYKVIKQ